MRAVITVRELLDTIIEEVAIKTGILLTDYDFKSFIESSSEMNSWAEVFDKKNYSVTVAVRPEFVEDVVRVIRYRLGNIPDASPGIIHSIAYSIETEPSFRANRTPC